MKKTLLFSLMLVGALVSAAFTSQSMAAVFHVSNAIEFQNALTIAKNNGEDDIIDLAAGTYVGNFSYYPPETEHRSLTIQGESGTRPEDVILDGQNSGRVLSMGDLNDYADGFVRELRIAGITVQNGNVSYGAGGIHARLSSYNTSIANCIIKNNRGGGCCGGIFMARDFNGQAALTTLTLEDNLILDNTVIEDSSHYSTGGGVFVVGYSNNSCDIVIKNNIIARNTVQGATDPQGGGIWVGWNPSNTIHLIGNTIYDNVAQKGGGVYFRYAQAANFYNNIVYGNTATQGGDIYFESVLNRIGHNNNYSNMYGTWTVSDNNLNTNPLFVSPKNNDYHLRPNSPMVNAGKSDVPSPPALPVTDFEGDPRSYGEAPDMGADEYAGDKHYPAEGTFGTEIAFLGSGFGAKKGKVLAGTSALKVLEWTQGTIRCQLAKVLSPGTYDVTIQPKAADPIVIDDGFTVKAPEIGSIDPDSGKTGDEITIYGFFFGTKKGKVTLGGKTCRVLRWTMDPTTGVCEIDFVVPKRLTPGVNELKIINGVGSDTVNFTVE